MSAGAVDEVLARLATTPRRVAVLSDARPSGNWNWLVETSVGDTVVLRRYHQAATPQDLAYEHAVLLYLAGEGWTVAEPVSELLEHEGWLYCLTRHVPGAGRHRETAQQRWQRGTHLARLHVALRPLGPRLGQRTGWRPQHTALTVRDDLEWEDCLQSLGRANSRLAQWADRAAVATHKALVDMGAGDLPVTVIHGDFAEWNVHFEGDRLAGVIDFALTHLDSRPFELAMARTYRAPEMVAGYCEELARAGWPLAELEEAAMRPVYHAVRVAMAAWFIDAGRRTGEFDEALIEGQLVRCGIPAG